MATEKQVRLIGDALARAIWDAPLPALQKLREDGYHDQCVDLIAQAMVAQLAHARWQMKGPPRPDNCKLDGFFHSAIKMTDCSALVSLNGVRTRRRSPACTPWIRFAKRSGPIAWCWCSGAAVRSAPRRRSRESKLIACEGLPQADDR